MADEKTSSGDLPDGMSREQLNEALDLVIEFEMYGDDPLQLVLQIHSVFCPAEVADNGSRFS